MLFDLYNAHLAMKTYLFFSSLLGVPHIFLMCVKKKNTPPPIKAYIKPSMEGDK